MTREHLWALLALAIAIGLAYILVSLSKDVQGEARTVCMDEKTRESLREQSFQAFGRAYQSHVARLFEVWVTDSHEEPKRAKVGLQNAMSAYLRAREDATKWAPPTCESHK